MRKLDKVSARLSFSPKYCRAVAKDAIKPLVVMYHEAVSIISWGSKNVLNLVYFLVGVYFWGPKCPKYRIFLGFSKIFCV